MSFITACDRQYDQVSFQILTEIFLKGIFVATDTNHGGKENTSVKLQQECGIC